MAKNETVTITNMCLIYDGDMILVQERTKSSWPGLTFPGGHVEDNESIEESVFREIKEETGLVLNSLEFVSYFEWNVPIEGVRHLVMLYRCNDFTGEIVNSKEGEVFFIKEEELSKYPLSTDFDKLLEILKKDVF
jgi:8-oxo-dGTP diphosphatase